MEHQGIKIDLEQDKLFDELGLKRLKESYMRDDETSPQQRFAHVSKAFSSNPVRGFLHSQVIFKYSISPSNPAIG